MIRLYKQKHGKLNETDAQSLAAALLKAGYTVAVRNEKIQPGDTAKSWIIELRGDDEK